MHDSIRVSSLHMPAEVFLWTCARPCGQDSIHPGTQIYNMAGPSSNGALGEWRDEPRWHRDLCCTKADLSQRAMILSVPFVCACACVYVCGSAYVLASLQSCLHALCTPKFLRDDSKYLICGTGFVLLPDIYFEQILGGVCVYLDLNHSPTKSTLSWRERDRSDMSNSMQTRFPITADTCTDEKSFLLYKATILKTTAR